MSRVGDNIKKAREEAKLPAKTVAKKVGISESALIEIENGRRVINEGLISRISKVLGKDVNSIGLSSFEAQSFKEEAQKRAKVVKDESLRGNTNKEETKHKEINEVWDKAFGNNLKSIPIMDMDLKNKLGSDAYLMENGKIDGYNFEKVFSFKYDKDDLIHYGINKGSILLAHQVKEVIKEGFYIFEFNKENLVRKCRNLGNGNILTMKNNKEEITQTISAKDIKVKGMIFKSTTNFN